MKKRTQGTFMVCLALFCACSKANFSEQPLQSRSESLLTISLSGQPLSKATGPNQGNQADDNYINTLEIFVFHADGENAGELDAYKKFTASDGLSNLQVKATTGNKHIYAVANSHRNDWKGINTLSKFQQITTNLQLDDVKNFVMVGSVSATLQVTTSVTFTVSRLAARICLSGIKTAFAGTPYEGQKLTNVKVWMLNVHSVKNVHDGQSSSNVILNNKKLMAPDVNACAMSGMLFDAVVPQVEDAGYRTPHYFYTYENTLESETSENRFTRLIVQADLNGKIYYYPVNINQVGYGYADANGHKGVKRNTAYEVGVTIFRPGSTDPDKPVEHGVLGVTLNVLDWNTTPVANPEF